MAARSTGEIWKAKREKADYKRFFSIVNKHSFSILRATDFTNIMQVIIEYILKNTNITIHYITNDPNDNIFPIWQMKIRRLRLIQHRRKETYNAYDEKLDADIVVMTQCLTLKIIILREAI